LSYVVALLAEFSSAWQQWANKPVYGNIRMLGVGEFERNKEQEIEEKHCPSQTPSKKGKFVLRRHYLWVSLT